MKLKKNITKKKKKKKRKRKKIYKLITTKNI